MICKYCHLKTHLIDKCPTIICKNCKEIGHPQWLCKEKKNIKNSKIENYEKKYSFNEDIKKNPSNENIKQKTLNYYLKINNELWSNLITL